MFRTTSSAATLLAMLALAAPTSAQVVTPPLEKPARTPSYQPQPPAPRVQPRPRAAQAPDVAFEPITRRDESGRIVPLEAPPEYVAMAHNPLIDLRTLARIAPGLYERRLEVERLVAENVDLLMQVEQGMIERTRMADEDSLRESTAALAIFTDNPGVAPSLYNDLVMAGLLSPDLALLTQKILQQHQQEVTQSAMSDPVSGEGMTPLDQMMHRVIRMSIAEFEYYFRRLMLDAADYFGQILPELDLDQQTLEQVRPLATRLESESDIDARAELIREIFGHLDTQSRRRALTLAIEMRPDVDPTTLMAPVPADATPVELDNQTRQELMFQIIEGGRVDTESFLE